MLLQAKTKSLSISDYLLSPFCFLLQFPVLLVKNLFKLLYEFFLNLYEYREYLKQSVARDLRKRYKRTSLGYLWSMLQPLFMMIVLSIAFSKIMHTKFPNYSVFLFTAMLPWGYFESTSIGCLDTIRANSKIIDQLAVPKFIFPAAVAFSNLVNFLLSLIPLFLVMLACGQPFTWTILLLPIVLIPLFIFTMGVSLVLALMNVFFEDTQHLTVVAYRALYFLSPVLYDRHLLPDHLVKFLVLNPLFNILEYMRNLFYYGQPPNLNSYFFTLLGSLVVLTSSIWLFKKTEDKFIYFM